MNGPDGSLLRKLILLVVASARSLSNWPSLNTRPSSIPLDAHGTRRRRAHPNRTRSASGPKRRGAPFSPRRETRDPAQLLGTPRPTRAFVRGWATARFGRSVVHFRQPRWPVGCQSRPRSGRRPGAGPRRPAREGGSSPAGSPAALSRPGAVPSRSRPVEGLTRSAAAPGLGPGGRGAAPRPAGLRRMPASPACEPLSESVCPAPPTRHPSALPGLPRCEQRFGPARSGLPTPLTRRGLAGSRSASPQSGPPPPRDGSVRPGRACPLRALARAAASASGSLIPRRLAGRVS